MSEDHFASQQQMPLALKFVLTALIALTGAICLPVFFLFGLQPLRNLLWDLSYVVPVEWVGPLLILLIILGGGLLLAIPATLLWFIWRK